MEINTVFVMGQIFFELFLVILLSAGVTMLYMYVQRHTTRKREENQKQSSPKLTLFDVRYITDDESGTQFIEEKVWATDEEKAFDEIAARARIRKLISIEVNKSDTSPV